MIYENEYMRYDDTTKVLRVKDIIKVFTREIQNTELLEDSNPKRCMLLPGMHFYRVVLPDCMERIADYAFEDMNMSKINIPNGITDIGVGAFSNCTWLEKIYWPKGTKCILRYTFDECEKLEEVILPEGLTTISGNAFQFCKALKNITIPSTVREFGACVFYACESLETINVPRSLYEKYHRDDCYFKSNSSAEVAVYDDSEVGSILKWIEDDDDLLSDEELYNEDTLSNENDNDSDDKIKCSLEFEYPTLYKFSPEDLEDLCDNMVMRIKSNKIPEKKFYKLKKVSKLIIENPNNNSNNGLIGEFAFQECDDLKEAIISDSISKIDKYAFYFCRCLKEVHLSAGLKSIGERAFKSCCDLEEITIPSTVTKLGEGLFEDDSNIKKIIAPKHLIDKYGEEYVRGHCNAEVIAYEVDDSLNVNESLKTASSDNSTETVKSNSVQRRSFNGTIKTNIIASKKNK